MPFSDKFADIVSHFGDVYRTGVCTDSRSDYPITGSQLVLICKWIHQCVIQTDHQGFPCRLQWWDYSNSMFSDLWKYIIKIFIYKNDSIYEGTKNITLCSIDQSLLLLLTKQISSLMSGCLASFCPHNIENLSDWGRGLFSLLKSVFERLLHVLLIIC